MNANTTIEITDTQSTNIRHALLEMKGALGVSADAIQAVHDGRHAEAISLLTDLLRRSRLAEHELSYVVDLLDDRDAAPMGEVHTLTRRVG